MLSQSMRHFSFPVILLLRYVIGIVADAEQHGGGNQQDRNDYDCRDTARMKQQGRSQDGYYQHCRQQAETVPCERAHVPLLGGAVTPASADLEVVDGSE